MLLPSQGLIVTLLSVGCLFGALFSGVFSDFLGRKATLLVGASVVACGGLLHTAAINLGQVLFAFVAQGYKPGGAQVLPHLPLA